MMSAEAALFQKFGREFPAGTVLFRENDTSSEMYVIQSGEVRITKNIRGQEKILATLSNGEFFGEMAVLNNKPRSASATVVSPTRMLVIEPKTFEAMVRGSTEIALRIIKRMAARLQEADEQIENLMLRDPASRVVHFLVKQRRVAGDVLPWTARKLTSYVGLPLHEIESVIDRLVKRGLLSVEADTIRVSSAERLEQLLEFLAMREQFGSDF